MAQYDVEEMYDFEPGSEEEDAPGLGDVIMHDFDVGPDEEEVCPRPERTSESEKRSNRRKMQKLQEHAEELVSASGQSREVAIRT
jgi:hypothetical protein